MASEHPTRPSADTYFRGRHPGAGHENPQSGTSTLTGVPVTVPELQRKGQAPCARRLPLPRCPSDRFDRRELTAERLASAEG
ncbi:hypothetical protein QFZ82_005389 [Streptomyces sp. V4I23]|nr:hypothetical protein [Streptomyces sp. V4I23]